MLPPILPPPAGGKGDKWSASIALVSHDDSVYKSSFRPRGSSLLIDPGLILVSASGTESDDAGTPDPSVGEEKLRA